MESRAGWSEGVTTGPLVGDSDELSLWSSESGPPRRTGRSAGRSDRLPGGGGVEGSFFASERRPVSADSDPMSSDRAAAADDPVT